MNGLPIVIVMLLLLLWTHIDDVEDNNDKWWVRWKVYTNCERERQYFTLYKNIVNQFLILFSLFFFFSLDFLLLFYFGTKNHTNMYNGIILNIQTIPSELLTKPTALHDRFERPRIFEQINRLTCTGDLYFGSSYKGYRIVKEKRVIYATTLGLWLLKFTKSLQNEREEEKTTGERRRRRRRMKRRRRWQKKNKKKSS